MDNPIYLNLGSGSVKLAGFINIDLSPEADMQLDLTKELPWADKSVHGIYSEHFIEHVSQAEAVQLLHECRRILVPGGIFRIATPDLDVIVQDYVGDVTTPTWKKYGYYWVNNRCERMNLAMREWGHKWLFNEEELVRLASMVGFSVRARCDFGQSADKVFQNLETREGSRLIIEFEKPDRTLALDPEPLVSIVIPSYTPTYFAKALESAISQTYQNMEIVICDDCRSDDIRKIALPYATEDARIRYMHNPEQLRRGNYIKCFDEAKGEFIKFLNDDDILEPNCVERMLDCFAKHPDIALATSRRQRIDEHDQNLPDIFETLSPVDEDSIIEGRSLGAALISLARNFVGEPTTPMFRKRDLLGIKPDFMSVDGSPVRAVNDIAIWVTLSMKGNVAYLVKPLSKFRVHPMQHQQLVNREEIWRLAQEGLNFIANAWYRFGFTTDPSHTIQYTPLSALSPGWQQRKVKPDISGWLPVHAPAQQGGDPATASAGAQNTAFMTGTQLLENGQLEQAYEHLSQALLEAPDNPDVLIQLGRLALEAGMLVEARDFFREAVSISAEGLRKAYDLGNKLSHLGQIEKAQLILNVIKTAIAKPAAGVINQEQLIHKKQKSRDLAVIVHLYYEDLFEDVARCLDNLEGEADLYFSVREECFQQMAALIAERYPDAVVVTYPNHGRDVLPFLRIFSHIADFDYKAICKIHTKKSLQRTGGSEWRDYILNSLLGDTKTIISCLSRMESGAGLVAPTGNYQLGSFCWPSNAKRVIELALKMGCSQEMLANFIFPAGTMFWFSPPALRPLMDLNLQAEDFEAEGGQTDGTTAHAVERLIGLSTMKSGLYFAESAEKAPGEEVFAPFGSKDQ